MAKKQSKQQPAEAPQTAETAVIDETAPVAPAVEETSEAPEAGAQAPTAPAAPEPTADAPDAAPVTTDATPAEADKQMAPPATAAKDVIEQASREIAIAMGNLLQQNYRLVDGKYWLFNADTPVSELTDEELQWHTARNHAPFVPNGITTDDPRWFDDPAPSPEPAPAVTIDDVLRHVGTRTEPVAGYITRSPHLHLTGEQAETLAEVYDGLRALGIAGVRDQADAVGWLLDEIRAATKRSG